MRLSQKAPRGRPPLALCMHRHEIFFLNSPQGFLQLRESYCGQIASTDYTRKNGEMMLLSARALLPNTGQTAVHRSPRAVG